MFRHMSDTKYFYTLKIVIALKCIKQNQLLSDMTGTRVILLKLLSICCFQIKQHWRVRIILFAAHSHFWPKILKSTHTHTSFTTSWNNHNATVHTVNMLQSPTIKQLSYNKKTVMIVWDGKLHCFIPGYHTHMSSFHHELITGKKDEIFNS